VPNATLNPGKSIPQCAGNGGAGDRGELKGEVGVREPMTPLHTLVEPVAFHPLPYKGIWQETRHGWVYNLAISIRLGTRVQDLHYSLVRIVTRPTW